MHMRPTLSDSFPDLHWSFSWDESRVKKNLIQAAGSYMVKSVAHSLILWESMS